MPKDDAPEKKNAEKPSDDSQMPKRTDRERKRALALISCIKRSNRQREEFLETQSEVMAEVLGEADPFKEIDESIRNDLGFAIRMQAPRLKAILDPIVASLMARKPRISVKPRNRTDDDLVKTAGVARDLIDKENREHDIKTHARIALKEGLMGPMSGMLTDYDTERKLPRATWIPLKRLIWDPMGNGLPSSMKYAGMEFTIPIHAAKKRYGKWLKADTSLLTESKKHEREKHLEDLEGITEKDFMEQKTLIRLWWRGDEVEIDDTSVESEDNDAEDHDGLLPTKNTVFVIDMQSKRILSEEPWPFTLDHDMLPIHFLVPEIIPGRVAAISTLSPYTHIQRLMHIFYSTAANTFLRTMKQVYVYKADSFDPDFPNRLRSMSNTDVIPFNEMDDLSKLDRHFRTLDLGSITKSNFDAISLFEGLFRDVSQSDDFSAGAIAGTEKATTANLAEGRVQNRIAVLADQTEDWMRRILKAKLQIALSVMTPEDVGDWIGEDRLGEQVVVPYVDENGNLGQEVVLRSYWPNLDAAGIRREIDLEIGPGSLTKKDPREEIADLTMLHQNLIGQIASANERLATVNKMIGPEKEFEAYNALTLAILDRLGEVDGEAWLIGNNDIIDIQPAPPPAPAVDPNQILQNQQSETELISQLLGQ